MAQTVQEPTRERMEIVDQPDELEEEKKKPWLRISLALVILAVLFFVVRRLLSEKEE